MTKHRRWQYQRSVATVIGGQGAADGPLEQFLNLPGRQLSQNCFAFSQAQPLQDPAFTAPHLP